MQNFISAVLGGLIVGTLFMLFAPDGSDPVATTVTTEEDEVEQLADPVARRNLEELSYRVRKLETHRNPGAKPRVVRTAIEASVPTDLRSRVRTLEADLADLRQRISALTFEPHRIDDRGEARRLIEISISQTEGKNTQYLGTIARIPLRLRFLESWPRHKDAPQHLFGLVNDYVNTRQYGKAMASVDRFGRQTGMPRWDLDQMRLQAAQRDGDRIAIARRLLSSPVDLWCRAWAMYKLADGLAETGQRDNALATIQALVAEFAGTSKARNSVRNAEILRERILAGR